MDKMCACGQPLHYTDPEAQRLVEKFINEHGEDIKVRSIQNGKTYLVQRHYLALHGIKSEDLPNLNFKEIEELDEEESDY